jgi:predicted nucleic acid-binding protein
MILALDTSCYIDFARGAPEVIEQLESVEVVAIPLIVLAELRAGFYRSSRSAHNERNLLLFMNQKRVEVVIPNEDTTHHYGRIAAYLQSKGQMIPINNVWIAALAIQHRMVLYTRDSDFKRIPNLALLT